MTQVILKLSLIPVIYGFLVLIGNIVNDFAIIPVFTQFFALLRNVVRPLEFMWDFQTSFIIIGYATSIMVGYFMILAFLAVKDIVSSND